MKIPITNKLKLMFMARLDAMKSTLNWDIYKKFRNRVIGDLQGMTRDERLVRIMVMQNKFSLLELKLMSHGIRYGYKKTILQTVLNKAL